jgi:hypothetical protein
LLTTTSLTRSRGSTRSRPSSSSSNVPSILSLDRLQRPAASIPPIKRSYGSLYIGSLLIFFFLSIFLYYIKVTVLMIVLLHFFLKKVPSSLGNEPAVPLDPTTRGGLLPCVHPSRLLSIHPRPSPAISLYPCSSWSISRNPRKDRAQQISSTIAASRHFLHCQICP